MYVCVYNVSISCDVKVYNVDGCHGFLFSPSCADCFFPASCIIWLDKLISLSYLKKVSVPSQISEAPYINTK